MKQIIKTLFFIVFLLGSTYSYAQPCGAVQSLSSNQQIQLNIYLSQFENALAQEDYSAIDSLNNLIKTALGTEAGKPDGAETYYNLVNTNTWLSLNNAILLSRQLIDADSIVYVDLWKVALGMAPPSYQPHSIALRTSAELAVGLLKIADKETDLNRKSLYQYWATRALDSLATMQLPGGAFPFPDLRPYNDPVFTPIIQNYLNSLGPDSSLVLINGWIIDDRNSGEFKFDAGVIGNAYYEAYEYTGNILYKNIALAIANYLLPLKINTNYNYNTFASLGLTRGYQLSGDTTYLNRAIINLRYGVYPGQITNGRWADGHNANSRYHNIIICNITPTINSIPFTNAYKPNLDTMAVRACQNLINYTNSCGAATGFRWLIAAYKLDSNLFTATTKNQLNSLIGRYISQAAINGKYLDVQTMGAYIELLGYLTLGNTQEAAIAEKTISPNPFSDKLNISFEYKETTFIKVSLYNNQGKLISIIDNGNRIKGTYNYTIDSSYLVPGVYYVVLQTPKGLLSSKIIKQ